MILISLLNMGISILRQALHTEYKMLIRSLANMHYISNMK